MVLFYYQNDILAKWRGALMENRNEDFVPAYIQIQNYILENIQNGTYGVGEKIPSETELSQTFSVNRNTANKAIKELYLMGVVHRVRGKGTFVSNPDNLPSAAKVLSPKLHLKPQGGKFHTLERCVRITLPDVLCRKFGLKSGAEGYEIVRSLHHRGKLEAFDFSYLPVSTIGSFSIDSKHLEQNYLHDYLKRCTNASPSYVKIYINTPPYEFLHIEEFFSETSSLLLWSTDILDKRQQVIASTITVSPEHSEDNCFITFSIE